VPHQVGLLVGLSLLAGLLVAGLALPAVGALGWAAKSTQDALDKMPTSLDEVPLAQHSILRAADGSVIATLAGPEDRVIVPLSSVPEVMQKSIIAIEDNRFYEHNGVDLRSLARAVRHDSGTGEFSQGASTITQQYVKQMLLEAANNSNATAEEKKEAQKEATEKSISRKLREARYAIALEKKLTKAQILERYLNIAYFGEGVYGVGRAAEHYFGVPVQKLTLAQSALLAGLVNSPSAFDPVQHPQASLQRRNTVLDAVEKYGFMPAAQVEAAKKEKLVVHPSTKAVDPCAVSSAPVFCRYALDNLLPDKAFGATQEQRNQTIFEGGLNIYTTYDAKTQQALDAGIRKNVPMGTRQVTAAVAIQPGTGRVLAIGQNRDYGDKPGQSKAVYATQNRYNVGSTFKAVTLTTALAQGLPLSTSFYSPACLPDPHYKGQGTKGCPNGVRNAGDSEQGTFNLVNGTWYSVNTYFVQLIEKVGVLAVRDMAQNLGDKAPGLDDDSRLGPSLTLGAANGTSAMSMATMYATLAAHGKECDPRFIDKITTLKGAPVKFTQAPACRQAVSAGVADTATSIMQGVLNQPGATAAGKGIGRPAAGKTGTVDDFTGAWFVGYVPQLVTAVGMFDPQNPSGSILPFSSLRFGTYHSSIYGGDVPASTWQSIMEGALQGVPVQSFSKGQLSAPVVHPTPPASPSTSATPGTPSTGTTSTPQPVTSGPSATVPGKPDKTLPPLPPGNGPHAD